MLRSFFIELQIYKWLKRSFFNWQNIVVSSFWVSMLGSDKWEFSHWLCAKFPACDLLFGLCQRHSDWLNFRHCPGYQNKDYINLQINKRRSSIDLKCSALDRRKRLICCGIILCDLVATLVLLLCTQVFMSGYMLEIKNISLLLLGVKRF